MMYFNSINTLCFLVLCLVFIQDVICNKKDVIAASNNMKSGVQQGTTATMARLNRRKITKRQEAYYPTYTLPQQLNSAPVYQNYPAAAAATSLPQQVPAYPAQPIAASVYTAPQAPVAPAAPATPVAPAKPDASPLDLGGLTSALSNIKLPTLPSFAPAASAGNPYAGYPYYYGAAAAKKDDDEDNEDDEDDEKDDDKNNEDDDEEE